MRSQRVPRPGVSAGRSDRQDHGRTQNWDFFPKAGTALGARLSDLKATSSESQI